MLTIGPSPEDQTIRVVAGTKNNIGPLIRSFTYRIIGLPDKGDVKNRSKLVWGEFVDLTADDILSVAPIKNTSKDTALKWLTQTLQSGRPVEKAKIERMGAARGFKSTDIEQAMEQLAVKKTQRGGREFWEKPSGDEEPNKTESHGSKHRPKSTVRKIKF